MSVYINAEPRIARWHCNGCAQTACELTTEDPDVVPRQCPAGWIAMWRRDRWPT